MFKRIKELQSLVDSSRKSLKEAERKVEERNILIADMERQANALYEKNKDLRFENDELVDFKRKVITIMTEKGTIISKYDKINELVNNLQAGN